MDKLTPYRQDHAQATYAPLIKKEDGLIDWGDEAISVERKVRAFSPWPSAFSYFRGKRMKILDGRVKTDKPFPSVKPGEIYAAQRDGIPVGCGDGNIYIINLLQPENRKAMSAHSFSLGANIKPGESFEG